MVISDRSNWPEMNTEASREKESQKHSSKGGQGKVIPLVSTLTCQALPTHFIRNSFNLPTLVITPKVDTEEIETQVKWSSRGTVRSQQPLGSSSLDLMPASLHSAFQ